MYIIPTGPTTAIHLLLGHPIPTVCCAVLTTVLWLLPGTTIPTALTCCRVQEETRTLDYCTVPEGPVEWMFMDAGACWTPRLVPEREQ